jgi:hypothetical protein
MLEVSISPDTGYRTELGYWEYDEVRTFDGTVVYTIPTTFNVAARLTNTHSPQACAGRGCAIHNHPSDHPLKNAPLYCEETAPGYPLYRKCKHDYLHLDYDVEQYLYSVGTPRPVHACDGCCIDTSLTEAEAVTDSWINEIQMLGGRSNT